MDWDIDPGDEVRRKVLHDRFGGSRQTGMSPSRQSPNVLLFSDPESGEQHGYYDGWSTDGVFEYTGEGQQGDQQMTKGNLALLNHRRDGRAVRLFSGSGGPVTYEGEFSLDPDEPYVERLVHSTGGGPNRRVFVFRLRPLQAAPAHDDEPSVTSVPIAHQNVESWHTSPSDQTKASATEAGLVKRYERHLTAMGDSVGRHRYRTDSGYLYNDLFNETRSHLVEAKGSGRRPDVRMAIGQLLDYSRLEDSAHSLGLLLPVQPAEDIQGLLNDLRIAAIWPTGRGFSDSAEGRFT